MNGLAIIVSVIFAIAAAVALFILGIYMLVWNINDIASVGANFWNVFWISLVAIVFVGGSSKAAS